MKLPEIRAECELCSLEYAGHRPEEVGWFPKREQWICQECWYDLNPDEHTIPLVYAKDAMLDAEEQMQRLIAAAARKRMGVKI